MLSCRVLETVDNNNMAKLLALTYIFVFFEMCMCVCGCVCVCVCVCGDREGETLTKTVFLKNLIFL